VETWSLAMAARTARPMAVVTAIISGDPRSELGRPPHEAAGEFGGGRPRTGRRMPPGRDLRLRRPYSRRRNPMTRRQRAGRDVPDSPLSPDEGDARHGTRRSETGTRESTRFFPTTFPAASLHETRSRADDDRARLRAGRPSYAKTVAFGAALCETTGMRSSHPLFGFDDRSIVAGYVAACMPRSIGISGS